jgi:hypothetical protein
MKTNLPLLHIREAVAPTLDRINNVVLILESNLAEQLIAEMIDRVTGKITNSRNMEFPRDKKRRRIVEFQPQIIRKGLTEKTITCFGWNLGDERRLFYQIRFYSYRESGQPVRFEISDSFNHENPAMIPMLF